MQILSEPCIFVLAYFVKLETKLTERKSCFVSMRLRSCHSPFLIR